ncbi:hypothetical protein GH733_006851 [Mirounga leonina]|nr:hypothetical protein GH733_006851 [Mirounga leonina]
MGNAGEGSTLLLAMPVKKLGCCLPCARGSPGEITGSLFCEFPVCEAGHEEGPLRQGLWLCQSLWRPLSFLHGTVAGFASFWTSWHLVLLASSGLSPGRLEWSCGAAKTPPGVRPCPPSLVLVAQTRTALDKNSSRRQTMSFLGKESLASANRAPIEAQPAPSREELPSCPGGSASWLSWYPFHVAGEHQNYFGIDENLGPVAVSIRREKVEDAKEKEGSQFNYRVAFRTSELTTLRGAILEDAIPSTTRHGTARGLPLKEVLEYVIPELSIQCLRQASNSPKVSEQLLKLDEQGLSFQHKIGILYCKAGQSTEEEMYNNETAGPAFEEFLDLLGQRVRLKGFTKYRAQLDNKTDSTGTHSLYTTYKDYEVMFHVSTMLPYMPNNRQQLLRKRHIGNDIVTIVFQEPGALPFTPRSIRSHFQHVFVIVKVHNPCTENVCYSVGVSRSKDVPPFGPPIPKGVTFPKSAVFRDFLLAKVINAENAAHKSEKFRAMATRTRQEYLKDLAENFVTTATVDTSVKFSFITLGAKKKEKVKPRKDAHLFSVGAIMWHVIARDFGQSADIECLLGISNEFIMLIEKDSKNVVFNCSCRDVIGWTSGLMSIKVFYERGECILLSSVDNCAEDIREIVQRLGIVTRGCETVEMTLRRNGLGQLGFHVNFEGIVADVEPFGFAWKAGLRQGSRLVEICKVAVATLTHEQMIDLLRTSVTVKVVIIQPHDDGSPRSGCCPSCSCRIHRTCSRVYKIKVERVESLESSCRVSREISRMLLIAFPSSVPSSLFAFQESHQSHTMPGSEFAICLVVTLRLPPPPPPFLQVTKV